MKQKYEILRDEDSKRLIIREYAELDKDVMSLLCEESYDRKAVKGGHLRRPRRPGQPAADQEPLPAGHVCRPDRRTRLPRSTAPRAKPATRSSSTTWSSWRATTRSRRPPRPTRPSPATSKSCWTSAPRTTSSRKAKRSSRSTPRSRSRTTSSRTSTTRAEIALGVSRAAFGGPRDGSAAFRAACVCAVFV
ncbi:MAG: hypothetical protein MZV70_06840 [Desulfobacterales bacterium]|nr:hypothetical protein [Desulfobacterales bacterium]